MTYFSARWKMTSRFFLFLSVHGQLFAPRNDLCHELHREESHHSRKMVNDSNIARRLADVLVVRIIAIACSLSSPWHLVPAYLASRVLQSRAPREPSPATCASSAASRGRGCCLALGRSWLPLWCPVREYRAVKVKTQNFAAKLNFVDSSSGDASVWGALSLAETLSRMLTRTSSSDCLS